MQSLGPASSREPHFLLSPTTTNGFIKFQAFPFDVLQHVNPQASERPRLLQCALETPTVDVIIDLGKNTQLEFSWIQIHALYFDHKYHIEYMIHLCLE